MLLYHPDYLGHTEIVSDANGEAYQYFWYSPFGDAIVEEHANTASFSSRYLFNAKELDPETGRYYYGARYYDPGLSIWLSVDPLAYNYPAFTPYSFVGNNPIMAIDPDGRKIWVVGDDGSKTEYTPGMNYEGEDEYTSNTINSLNAISETEAGSKVISDLVDSKDANYNYSSGDSPLGDNAAAYKSNGDGSVGTIYTSGMSDIETIAHEGFHAYQDFKGQGGASIYNEVEAYLFGESMALNTGSMVSGSFGMARTSSIEGNEFQNAADQLLTGAEFSEISMIYAVGRFKSQSSANSTGLYDNFNFKRQNQKVSLIKGFYPLLP